MIKIVSIVLVIVFLFTGCMGLRAEDYSWIGPSDLMELNRNGQWQTVHQESMRLLEQQETYSQDEYCLLYIGLAYAEMRLGNSTISENYLITLEQFLAESGTPPELQWMHDEIVRIRLGMR